MPSKKSSTASSTLANSEIDEIKARTLMFDLRAGELESQARFWEAQVRLNNVRKEYKALHEQTASRRSPEKQEPAKEA
ncbi:MAG TPA: hypothetical protein VHT03_14565 [Rhizomicrobium sp.]|jgi:hypothetical protein|nr:hypothetical protein [Rhizomicrobium sp.]